MFVKKEEEVGVIYLLIGASLFIAILFLVGFIWSVKNGQYDDDYTPSVRILFDDKQTDGSYVNSNKHRSDAGKKG